MGMDTHMTNLCNCNFRPTCRVDLFRDSVVITDSTIIELMSDLLYRYGVYLSII